MFPVAERIERDGTVVCDPCGIRLRQQPVVRNDVAEELGPVAPWCFVETPDFRSVAVVPTVAEQDRHGVFPRFQEPGHIIFNIGIAFVVLRHHGSENAVIRFPSVDVQFMPAESAEVDFRLSRRGGAVKRFAQIRGAADLCRGGAHLFSGIDPVTVPVACHEKNSFFYVLPCMGNHSREKRDFKCGTVFFPETGYSPNPSSSIRFPPSAAVVASSSQRLFSGLEACPLTQMNLHL